MGDVEMSPQQQELPQWHVVPLERVGNASQSERFAKQIIRAVDRCEVHRQEKAKRAEQEEQ